jgi:probable rRNA maturation factor
LGCPDSELSITLVNEAAMAELSSRYGRPARPTDVLAFSLLEGEGAEFRGACLGDVVLCIELADRQARERGVSLDEELRDLLIHGILHLLGMNHDRPPEARAMRQLEAHLRWELERAC